MRNKTNIQKIADDIYKKFKPISVFLYGSRARTDFSDNSDYEIGVIQQNQGDVKRIDLNNFVKQENVLVYPFVKNELENYTLNTPFQREIYMYELIKTSKTLAGSKIIENITPPKITTINLIESVGFNSGQALAAIFAFRQSDWVNSTSEFVKSCLYATRVLEIFELEKFPFEYKEIYNLSKQLDLAEYREVVDHAYDLRHSGKKPKEELLYKNLSYINKFIKDKILISFKRQGNTTFLQKIEKNK